MLHRLPLRSDVREARRDQLVRDYVRAMTSGDDDAIDQILSAAAEDPALDARLSDVDRSLLEEQGIPSAQAAAEVDHAVQRHLVATASADGTLTVGRVAAALKASGRLPPNLHGYNDALLAETSPLPSTFRASHYAALLAEVSSPPSPAYVDAFASQAGRLITAAPSGHTLLAARSTRRPS